MPETELNTEQPKRIFKIGSITIHEDESLGSLSIDDVKKVLAHQYPQVLNSTHLSKIANGVETITFSTRAGSKG